MHLQKKYSLDELITWNEEYLQQHQKKESDQKSFVHLYPAFDCFHSSVVYQIYLEDLYHKLTGKDTTTTLLAPFEKNSFLLGYLSQYFGGKKYSLLQVGNKKIYKHLASQSFKNEKNNTKTCRSLFHEPLIIETNNHEFSTFAQKTFVNLWKKGTIVQEQEIAYRSFSLQSVIPNEDIIFQSTPCQRYEIKYFIDGKGISISTFTYEVDMIFGDVALLVHPKDKRYKQHIGKKVLIPIINKVIPILGDETIDISQNNGVKRVNPFSDPQSLKLAEKHHLPKDIRVFDLHGKYTNLLPEFAGKPRATFYSNIIEYLHNIMNIGEITETEAIFPYARDTGERLIAYPLPKCSFKTEAHLPNIKEKINNLQIRSNDKELFLTKLQEKYTFSLISPYGIRIPLFSEQGQLKWIDQFPFTPKEYTKEEYYLFDYMLLRICCSYEYTSTLQYDLFIPFLVSLQRQIPQFLDTITEKKEKKNLIIDLIQKLAHGEEGSLEELNTYIENSHLLTHSKEELCFSYFQEHQIEFPSLIYSDIFLQSIYPLYFQKKGYTLQETYCIPKEQLFTLGCTLLLDQSQDKIIKIQSLICYDDQFPQEDKGYSFKNIQLSKELLQMKAKYGDDALRISLLIHKDHHENHVHEYDTFLRQLRNGIRYIIQYFPYEKHFEEALQTFYQQGDDLDIRILSEILDLYQEQKMLCSREDLLQAAKDSFIHLQYFTQAKLLSRYLEIRKIETSPATPATCFIIISFLISTLSAFVPTYTRALLHNIGDIYHNFHEFSLKKERSTQIVFLYNLFDQIYQFKKELQYTKFQPLFFSLKTDPNSLEWFSKYQTLFQKFFCFQKITLLRLHETDPEGYEQKIFGNTIIGLKKKEDLSQTITKKEALLNEKIQLLEYYKSLILMGMDDLGIQEKFKTTKSEVEVLTIEIQKMKKKVI